MKFKKLAIFLIIFALITALLPINALAASSSMSGPSTVRSGDTIYVKFVLSGLSNTYGAQATINYTSSVLTYKSCTSGVSSWDVTANKSGSSIYITAADEGSLTPISGTKTICTLKFTVKGSTGTKFSVSASNVKYSIPNSNGGYKDVSVSGSTYSKTIAAPLSTNANLASLGVSNAKVYPSFSASTTSYKTSVDFAVSSLKISAKAADSSAKVSISNNSLKAGGTTNVRITVTAEAGNKKTYTIAATREQDPNYVPSDNNYLSSISLDKGILSPVFKKDITNYVVWLPYEISSIDVSAKAQDSKASVKVSGGQLLNAGEDNIISVVCAAEDGTEKEYKITVKRAQSWEQEQQDVDLADVASVMAEFEKMTSDESDVKNILLNLSASASKQVSAELFEELKKHPDVSLTINVGDAKIIFKGSDIDKDISKEYYDLSFAYSSEYAELIKEKADDENGIVFSFAYEGDLPGYAAFYLMTDLNQGDKYNIYKYSLKDEKFYLIAQDVSVMQAGLLPYANNTCSEYIITQKTIEGAAEYESVSKQSMVASSVISAYKDDIMTVIIIFFALAIGFASGMMVYKNISEKKRRKEQCNIIKAEDIVEITPEIKQEEIKMISEKNEREETV